MSWLLGNCCSFDQSVTKTISVQASESLLAAAFCGVNVLILLAGPRVDNTCCH